MNYAASCIHGVTWRTALVVSLALAFPPVQARAQLITITDTTLGGASVDGTIGAAEFIGRTAGVNSGFGDVLGSGSLTHIDSDALGNLQLGLQLGAGAFNDIAVIYIDSVPGGVADLVSLADIAGDHRAAISGDGTDSSFSDLTFAPGFAADYALAWNNISAELYRITAGAAHTFLGDLGAVSTTPGHWETSLSLADIGVSAGGALDYFVTYMNPSNAYRSNEGTGFLALSPPSNDANGNPGNDSSFPGDSTWTMNEDEFIRFVTAIPEPSTFAFMSLALVGLLTLRRRRD